MKKLDLRVGPATIEYLLKQMAGATVNESISTMGVRAKTGVAVREHIPLQLLHSLAIALPDFSTETNP